MESLVKCKRCGKKPRVKPTTERKGWEGQSMEHEPDPSGMNLRPANPKTSPKKSPTKSGSSPKKDGSSPKKGDSVFDRLTNSKNYTGAHKHRFDESGKGRGKAGRDVIAKGSGSVPSMGVSNQANPSSSTDKKSPSKKSLNGESADSPLNQSAASPTAEASTEEPVNTE